MSGFDQGRREALAGGLTMLAAGAAAAQPAQPAQPAQSAAGAGAGSAGGRAVAIEAWQVGAQQGVGSLQRVERPAPRAGHGEVVVEVRASALNHRDLSIAAGRYGAAKPPTRVPLGDGAGVVLECGPGVSGVQPGDRVTAPHFTRWIDGDYDPSIFAADAGNTLDGWLAQRIVLPAAALVRLPESLGFEAAAALGAAGITAWAVLESLGRVKAGDTVLTLGTGGVAVLALQIARMNGARVIITSSSDDKLAACRALGADVTINYRTQPAWQDAVRAATGGRGVDIVVETVGLATLGQSLACCAPNARIGLLGSLGTPPAGATSLGSLILNNVVLKGITSGSRRMLEDLLRACAANGLQPRIDRSFAFRDAPAAYAYLAAGGHVGKVLIRHDGA